MKKLAVAGALALALVGCGVEERSEQYWVAEKIAKQIVGIHTAIRDSEKVCRVGGYFQEMYSTEAAAQLGLNGAIQSGRSMSPPGTFFESAIVEIPGKPIQVFKEGKPDGPPRKFQGVVIACYPDPAQSVPPGAGGGGQAGAS